MRDFVIEDDNLLTDDDSYDESDDNDADNKSAKSEEEQAVNEVKLGMIKKLSIEWNELHTLIEQRSFRSRDDRGDEADYHGEMADDHAYDKISQLEEKNKKEFTDSEKKELMYKFREEYFAVQAKVDREPYVKLEVIEGLLSSLGARMARPYEHWNEDEKYMEYMETRYDSYDDDY
jgi:hypothetical protein